MNKKIYTVLIIALALFFVKINFAAADCTNGNNPPTDGDWLIGNETICEDMAIVLNGNLTINDTGNATFRNVTLYLNSSYNLSNGISVSGGSYYIYPNSAGEPSSILAYDPLYHYKFAVYSGSTFIIADSEVSDVGINSDLDKSGLYIAAHNAIVNSSNISNSVHGVIVDFANNTQIIGNDIFDIDFFGVLLFDSNYALISDNFIEDVGADGVRVVAFFATSNHNVINGNTILNPPEAGILVDKASDINITENLIQNSEQEGISIENVNTTALIANNTITSSGFTGIKVFNSIGGNYLKLLGNSVSDTQNIAGIWLAKTNFTDIGYNNLSENYVGLYLTDSQNNSIHDNTIYLSEKNGIYLTGFTFGNRETANNTIENNTISNTTIGPEITLADSDSNVIKNNTILSDMTGIYLSSSHKNNLFLNNLESSVATVGTGIASDYGSTNNNISENEIKFFGLGIYLKENIDTTIANNEFVKNGYGIIMGDSFGIDVFNNLINNTDPLAIGGFGIEIFRSNATIGGNEVIKYSHGIYISDNSYPIIENNTLASNEAFGIFLINSSAITSPPDLNGTNTFAPNNSEGRILQQWFLTVRVIDTNSNPIEGADVLVCQNITNTCWGTMTDPNGYVYNLGAIEYDINNSGILTDWSLHNISANKTGYVTNSTLETIDSYKSIIIQLAPIPPTPPPQLQGEGGGANIGTGLHTNSSGKPEAGVLRAPQPPALPVPTPTVTTPAPAPEPATIPPSAGPTGLITLARIRENSLWLLLVIAMLIMGYYSYRKYGKKRTTSRKVYKTNLYSIEVT